MMKIEEQFYIYNLFGCKQLIWFKHELPHRNLKWDDKITGKDVINYLKWI